MRRRPSALESTGILVIVAAIMVVAGSLGGSSDLVSAAQALASAPAGGLADARSTGSLSEPAWAPPIPIRLAGSPTPAWARWHVSASYDAANDRYLLCWTDLRNWPGSPWADPYGLGSNADIYCRIVRSDGSTVLDDFPVRMTGRDEQWSFSVYNPTRHEFLVAWQEVDPAATEANWYDTCYNIMAQRVRDDGTLIGDAITVSDAIGCQWVPQVALDDAGQRYLLAFHNYHQQWDGGPEYDSQKDIMGQWLAFDPDGNLAPSGSNFPVTVDDAGIPAPRYQEYVGLLNNGGDTFYACWSDDRTGSGDSHAHDIYCTTLKTGQVAGLVNRMLVGGAATQEKPRLARDRNGNLWIAYETLATPAAYPPTEPGAVGAYVVRANPSVTPLASPQALEEGETAGFTLPEVACTSEVCAVVWGGNATMVERLDLAQTPLEPAQVLYNAIVLDNVLVSHDEEFAAAWAHDGSLYLATWAEGPSPATSTPSPSPSPSRTRTRTPTSTPTLTPTPTDRLTPTATATPTMTPTDTPSPTPSLTPSPTSSSMPSPTASPTATPTRGLLYLPLLVR